MPIGADQFEDIDDEADLQPGTNGYEIVSFLASNPEQAFTQSEIAAEIDVPRGSVGPTLVRLREDGRVDHRGTYWRISDHERSVRAASDHAGATAASRETESFDYESWQEHAVDPREFRD